MNNEEKIERMMFNMLAHNSTEPEDVVLGLKGFERFYLFTNEHMNAFLKSMNLNNKRVLTVGSSGDQIIYSLVNGAREIVCFDICPFAEHYFNLKVACIKNFTYNEFEDISSNAKNIISLPVYKKVSHSMPRESQEFWDHLFIEGFNERDFEVNRADICLAGKDVYLNNKALYTRVQNVLKQPYNVKFIESDMRNITKILKEESNFDLILLSNIFQYARSWKDETSRTGEEIFIDAVKDIQSLLAKDGTIQIDYAYTKQLDKYNKFQQLLGAGTIRSFSSHKLNAGQILYKPNEIEVNEI